MQAMVAAEPALHSSDDADLRPIPMGSRTLTFLRRATPAAWEPVEAVARALDRLQRRSHNVQQEVRRDTHTRHVAERQL